MFLENYKGVFNIPLIDLKDPGDFGIRKIDADHVKELEHELSKYSAFDIQAPIVVMVDPLSDDPDKFNSETRRCYKFLVLSGNHRRQALTNIMADPERSKTLKLNDGCIDVHVYCGKIREYFTHFLNL